MDYPTYNEIYPTQLLSTKYKRTEFLTGESDLGLYGILFIYFQLYN